MTEVAPASSDVDGANKNDMPTPLTGDGATKRKPTDVANANQGHAEAAAAKANDGDGEQKTYKEPIPEAQRLNVQPAEEHHEEAEQM